MIMWEGTAPQWGGFLLLMHLQYRERMVNGYVAMEW